MRNTFALIIFCFFVVTGCSDNPASPAGDNSQPVFEIVRGNSQIGVVSDTLASDLVVSYSNMTQDGLKEPVSNVSVQFTTQPDNGIPTTELVKTDENGEATTKWVLGDAVALQLLRAAALQEDGTEAFSVNFSATAGPESMTLLFIKPPVGLVESYALLRQFLIATDGFNHPIHPDLVAALVTFDAPGPLLTVSGDTLTAVGEGKETVTATYRSATTQQNATFIHDLAAFDWDVSFSGYSSSGLDSVQAALSIDAVTYATNFREGGSGLFLELSGEITRYPVGGGSTVSDTTGVLISAVELPNLLAYVKPDTSMTGNVSWFYSFASGADYTVPGEGVSYLIPADTGHDFGPVISPGMASYSSTSLVGTRKP